METHISWLADEEKALESSVLAEYSSQEVRKHLSPIQKSIPCLTHAFASSTPPEGLEAKLISLGNGTENDYEGVGARGKIVLVEPGETVVCVLKAMPYQRETGTCG